MWDAVVAIRDESRKALSAKGQWDGRTKHIHLKGLNVEVFRCLHSTITDGLDGELIEKKDKGSGWLKPQKVLNCDLSNEHKRVRQKSHMIRALDEPSLKRFKLALGTTFGVANPTPVPKLKEIDQGIARANVPLKNHTLVRITTCREEDKDEDNGREILPIGIASSNLNTVSDEDAKLLAKIERQKHAKRCPFPGLDMEYTMGEDGMTDLHFTIKFKKMRGDSEAVLDLIRKRVVEGGAPGEQPIPAVVTEDEILAVELDDRLVYQGNAYKVVTVDDVANTATIVRVVNTVQEPPITIDGEVAMLLVNAYYY
ncbi:MAG: hypothetical protein SGARI_005535 [Bacillariaceae sp.]